jgi:hypothetical protein
MSINEQEPESHRRHDKHVDGSDVERLVAQEATPGRRRRVWPAHHVHGDGGLTDFYTEPEQLAMNARRTPERVGDAHLTDQFARIQLYGFSP